MSEVAEKRCNRGKRLLPLAHFAKDKNRGAGLQVQCRECVAEYSAAHHRRRRAAVGKTVREKVDVPRGHKLCRARGVIKPHSEWHCNATAPDGLSTRRKACRAIRGRADHLKRQHGVTEAERDETIAAQNGLCAICLSAPAVHVDHCHTTGRVRGLLCFNCNSAIGKLGDDPAVVRRTAAHLEGKTWKPTLVAPGVSRLPS